MQLMQLHKAATSRAGLPTGLCCCEGSYVHTGVVIVCMISAHPSLAKGMERVCCIYRMCSTLFPAALDFARSCASLQADTSMSGVHAMARTHPSFAELVRHIENALKTHEVAAAMLCCDFDLLGCSSILSVRRLTSVGAAMLKRQQ